MCARPGYRRRSMNYCRRTYFATKANSDKNWRSDSKKNRDEQYANSTRRCLDKRIHSVGIVFVGTVSRALIRPPSLQPHWNAIVARKQLPNEFPFILKSHKFDAETSCQQSHCKDTKNMFTRGVELFAHKGNIAVEKVQ